MARPIKNPFTLRDLMIMSFHWQHNRTANWLADWAFEHRDFWLTKNNICSLANKNRLWFPPKTRQQLNDSITATAMAKRNP